MNVASVEPLHALSRVARPEVGSSALAAWLARRVATVNFSGLCFVGTLLLYSPTRVDLKLAKRALKLP